MGQPNMNAQNFTVGNQAQSGVAWKGLGLDSFNKGRTVLSVHRRHLKDEETRNHEGDMLGQKSHSEFVSELRTGAEDL